MYNYHLVGPHEGKTITLGGHRFVDGVFEYGPNADGVAPSQEEATRKGRFLAKSYQAYLEGPELNAARARANGDKDAPALEPRLDVANREDEEQANREPSGAGGEAAKAATQRKGAVRTALTKLDATKDEHWTGQGLPSVEAVRELSGNKDVSRQDIGELAPNLNREEAKKVQGALVDPLDD